MSQRFRPSPKDQATRPGCVCLESYCGVHTNPVSRKLTPRFLSDMSVNSKGHCSLHVIYSEMTVLLKIFISLFVVGSEQRNIPGSLGHHRPNFSCRESVSRQILESNGSGTLFQWPPQNVRRSGSTPTSTRRVPVTKRTVTLFQWFLLKGRGPEHLLIAQRKRIGLSITNKFREKLLPPTSPLLLTQLVIRSLYGIFNFTFCELDPFLK